MAAALPRLLKASGVAAECLSILLYLMRGKPLDLQNLREREVGSMPTNTATPAMWSKANTATSPKKGPGFMRAESDFLSSDGALNPERRELWFPGARTKYQKVRIGREQLKGRFLLRLQNFATFFSKWLEPRD
jgi:hypothetical protein